MSYTYITLSEDQTPAVMRISDKLHIITMSEDLTPAIMRRLCKIHIHNSE